MAISGNLYDAKTGERKYLNARERQAFLEATQLEEAKVKYYCQLLYYTGCRTAEGLQLSPARLDYSEQTVTFQTLKQGTNQVGEPIVRYRTNELPETYLNELQDVYNILKLQRSRKQREQPIWAITERTAYNYVTRVMQRAGISGTAASPRGLRHSMGVALAINKVPVNTIQRVLGHASISNTMLYLDIISSERRDLVSQVW